VILTRAGDAYRNLNDFDRSVDYYQRALNIGFDTYAVLGLAVVAKTQGKHEEAIESLHRLIQQDPRNYRFYAEIVDCYVRKSDRKKALEYLGKFQKLGIRNNTISELADKLSY
jgi:tetratricopeptide (TPR) repeat protein